MQIGAAGVDAAAFDLIEDSLRTVGQEGQILSRCARGVGKTALDRNSSLG